MSSALRIGTRGSPLALWQANHVAAALRAKCGDLPIELVEIQTSGDQVRDVPLSQLGGQGLFTKEIQRALLDGRVDVAVHSLKDLPTVPTRGLILVAVPTRGAIGDVLVSVKHSSVDALPQGARIATGSPRRRAQLLHHRPDLRIVDIRGNVETRLNKLIADGLDGILLAEAGLERLGFSQRITEVLSVDWMLPAVGQGALGLECRAQDQGSLTLVKQLNDCETHQAVLAERAFLRCLGGGCQTPIGVHSASKDGRLLLRGVVLDPDGTRRVYVELIADGEEGEKLGRQLAEDALASGADELLRVP